MKRDVDVLVVGAGPTGLMMALQLVRQGVEVRVIDKQVDRTRESRAFAIQARSMEILDRLGLADEFLSMADAGTKFRFYVRGKQVVDAEFGDVGIEDSPYRSIYMLPQSETERILGAALERAGVHVERPKEMVSFVENAEGITAELGSPSTEAMESVSCRYIVGCDGAHSRVRHLMGVPFEGAPYEQEFILADAEVDAPFVGNGLTACVDDEGLLLHVQLGRKASRLIAARLGPTAPMFDARPPDLAEIQDLATKLARTPVKVSNLAWSTRFRLHHRAAKEYSRGRAFIAGDAAHIHSPVGGQGMNTGLQDATNLAWKMASVLKGAAPESLLETYQTERHRIGEILLNRTDRAFSLITSSGMIASFLRARFLPLILPALFEREGPRAKLFRFVSQLGIRYHENPFVREVSNPAADEAFRQGPQAGCRAPDVKLFETSLFEKFRNPLGHLLFFADEHTPGESRQILHRLDRSYSSLLRVHVFEADQSPSLLRERYGITSSGVYFVRPDGHVGFRSWGSDLEDLETYLEDLWGLSVLKSRAATNQATEEAPPLL